MVKRKDFMQAGLSAAEAFISKPEETKNPQPEQDNKTLKEQVDKQIPQLPDGFILQREPKSKHLQLLIRPTLFEALKNISAKKGVSVNEYCNQILEQATKEE